MSSSAALQAGVARVGKYLMLDRLGEGAFGKVRLAVDEETGKEYAIKIMDKTHIKANELTLQVRREIAVMKAMRHPNIVNLHEVLTSSKNIFMVMDLVTGGELFDAVAKSGRLCETQTRSYFQQLVDGVCYCHSRRVFHRDLKPENLLLSGDKQTIKITDFGLSSIKAQNASSELLHTIMGSPHYIAPEIITSAAQGYDGSKVDVWACGVILFGMLAGFLPFDEPDTKGLYSAIVHSTVRYPPQFSYDVIKLLRAMLQKDPSRRPTAEQVKAFTWFKVNYEPAVVQDGPRSTGSSGQHKKFRLKKPKRGERSGNKKRKDGTSRQSAQLDEQVEKEQEQEISNAPGSATKLLSELFKDSSRHSAQSMSSSRPSFAKSLSKKTLSGTTNISATELEQTGYEHEVPSSQKVPSAESEGHEDVLIGPSDKYDDNSQATREFSVITHPSTGLFSEGTRQESVQELPVSRKLSEQRQLSDIEEGTEKSESQDVLSQGDVNCMVIPRFADREDLKDDVIAPSLHSPLTPQVSRFSSALSSVGSGPEERECNADDQEQGNIEEAQETLSNFVSPLSEFSPSSFKSPNEETREPTFLKSSYEPKEISLFSPFDSLAKNHKKHGDGDEGSADEETVADEITQPVERELELEAEEISECPSSSGDAIFRPVKSMFKRLILSCPDHNPDTSLAPSPLCPDFEYDSDGGPQWCLDSNDVFADVDSVELELAVSSTTSQQKGSHPGVGQNEEIENSASTLATAHGELLNCSSPLKPKSIFAPLRNDIVSKLTPANIEERHSGPFHSADAREVHVGEKCE